MPTLRLLVVVALTLVVTTGSSSAASVKVMPLGDSITEWGYSLVSDGYRRKLADKLKAAGRADEVQWVGSKVDNLGYHHEGHSGYHISMVVANATAWLTAAHPDVILLQIGTNDMSTQHSVDVGGIPGTQSPANQLANLIKLIYSIEPNVAVVVSQIPPMSQYDPTPITDPAMKAKVAAELAVAVPHYDDAIPGVVRTFAQQGKRITAVDMFHALTLADLVDGVHPNDVGFGKMADTWYPALLAMLDGVEHPGAVDAGAPADAAAARDGAAGQGGSGGSAAGVAGSIGGSAGDSSAGDAGRAGGSGGSAPAGRGAGAAGHASGVGGAGGRGGTGGADTDPTSGGSSSGCAFAPRARFGGAALWVVLGAWLWLPRRRTTAAATLRP